MCKSHYLFTYFHLLKQFYTHTHAHTHTDTHILVTADVVGSYPNIPHEVGLTALRETLDKRDEKTIPTEELMKIAKFVLKSNYFEFGNKIKQQISGNATGTKFAPPCVCIITSDIETKFLEGQH